MISFAEIFLRSSYYFLLSASVICPVCLFRGVEPVLLPRGMQHLLALAQGGKSVDAGAGGVQPCSVGGGEVERSGCLRGDWKSTVHALNVLRVVFLDGALADDVGPYVTQVRRRRQTALSMGCVWQALFVFAVLAGTVGTALSLGCVWQALLVFVVLAGTVAYSVLQNCTVLHSAVQHSALQQCSTIQLHCTAPHCISVKYSAVQCSTLHGTAFFSIL